MSVELEPDGVRCKSSLLSRSVAEIARTTEVDPRIPALVPGFDAPFFQAGLAGFSDGAMRLVARRHGAPFCVTEALLDRTVISGLKGRRKEDPDLLAQELGDVETNRTAGLDDHPIAGQIMGTEPGEMEEGARLLAGMNYDVIDVNFACPVKKIAKANRGGHFLAAPDDAIRVLEAVRRGVPDSIPTSVKLRRGYDDTPEMAEAFEQIFTAAYELGYAWTTVHCRTVDQKYRGPGKWSFLKDLVARHPEKLIFGSGDIWSVDDIFAMLEFAGVHAVSVARGCIGDPWIFRQARQLLAGEPPTEPTRADQRETLLEHLEYSVALHGEWMASRLMRKFASKFTARHPQSTAVKKAFVACDSPEAWYREIDRHYL